MRHDGAGGFMLVEVLVALVILSVAAVVMLQLFGGGLRLVSVAGDHVGAALLASAKLADTPPSPLEEEVDEGTAGAYRWTRRVAFEPPLVPFESTARESTTVRLARVSVEVRWGKNRRIEMTTLRSWSTKQ